MMSHAAGRSFAFVYLQRLLRHWWWQSIAITNHKFSTWRDVYMYSLWEVNTPNKFITTRIYYTNEWSKVEPRDGTYNRWSWRLARPRPRREYNLLYTWYYMQRCVLSLIVIITIMIFCLSWCKAVIAPNRVSNSVPYWHWNTFPFLLHARQACKKHFNVHKVLKYTVRHSS